MRAFLIISLALNAVLLFAAALAIAWAAGVKQELNGQTVARVNDQDVGAQVFIDDVANGNGWKCSPFIIDGYHGRCYLIYDNAGERVVTSYDLDRIAASGAR